jgi:AraC-like DNA-binding protein
MSTRPPVLNDAIFRRLCRARDYGHACFAERIDTTTLAREAAMSTFHFHRLFTGTFGITPHDFITQLRIERAKRLLASGEWSVSAACLESGYESLGSFSARFHALVGTPPTRYQREIRRVFGVVEPVRTVFIPACFLEFAGIEI